MAPRAHSVSLPSWTCHERSRLGDELPLLWHWPYFTDVVSQSELGPDGHPARTGGLAERFSRRIVATGSVERLAALQVGPSAKRDSYLEDLTRNKDLRVLFYSAFGATSSNRMVAPASRNARQSFIVLRRSRSAATARSEGEKRRLPLSYLYVPGDSLDRLAKLSHGEPARAIADLEKDAVSPGRKAEAPDTVRAWLATIEQPDQTSPQIWVRIDSGGKGEADLAAVLRGFRNRACMHLAQTLIANEVLCRPVPILSSGPEIGRGVRSGCGPGVGSNAE